MEKPKLNEDELVRITCQYHYLTDDLEIYRKNMRGIKYRRSYPAAEREKHKKQYKFLRFSLNETVMVLILHNHAGLDLLSDAMKNRFLTFRTKWIVLKKLFHDISNLKKQ